MSLAIFGITNTTLNLVVTFAVLGLVAIWIALIVFTFNDARRRIADPFLVGCATAASLFPFIGTVIYTILRPPEFLEDVKERETELDTSDTQLRHLKASACGRCGFPTEHDFMRCPSCRTRLKEPCPTCAKPVGLEWKLCPYCETTLIAPKQQRSSRSSSKSSSRGSGSSSGSSSQKDPAKASSRSSRKKDLEASRRQAEGSAPEASRSSSRSSSKSSSRREERASSSDTQEAPRSSRSSRRKVVVPDEEPTTPAHAPINSGNSGSSSSSSGSGSPSPRSTPENR